MLHLSDSEGTGGAIKASASDFIVKEITGKGRVLEPGRKYGQGELGEEAVPEGKFTTFVLQKRDWNTVQALVVLAKKLGHGKKSIGYAGTKDRRSVSVQLASIYGTAPEQVLALRAKDLEINGAWRSNGVEMGSNLGNAFEVAISDVKRQENAEAIIRELDGIIPNYFDRQRFGTRLNNARIGFDIMRGEFEEAAMAMLTDTAEERNEDAVEARKRLGGERDFRAALSYFPGYLKNERYLLEYISTHSKDYAGALRRLPRGISLMFIHAVQSLIFNLEVEDRIRRGSFESSLYCDRNFYGFPDLDGTIKEKGDFPVAPLIGYETDDARISDKEKELLERFGITKESFRIRSMPELSMRGSLRTLVAPVKDLFAEVKEGTMKLSFAIPSGTYATVLVNEITKADDLDLGRL